MTRTYILARDDQNNNRTFGTLHRIDSSLVCQTLEPPPNHVTPGRSCIPAGIFTCLLRYSPKHKYAVFGLMNVPGFSNVELHIGNDVLDTEACILVGTARDRLLVKGQWFDAVVHSVNAFTTLMAELGCTEYATLTSFEAVAAWNKQHPNESVFYLKVADK